jgi:putative ABC transport system permease protein
MTIWSSIGAALEALRANTLRTGLTMLGVIIGVAAVITTVAVATGAHSRVTQQIQTLGSNLILVLSGSINAGGVRLGMGSQLTITEDDARAIQREIATVAGAAAVIRGAGQVVAGNLNWSTIVQGVTVGYLDVREWTVTGRPMTDDDENAATKVAMLGDTVAQKLFGSASPIGQVIRIRGIPFTVVGVLGVKGQNAWGLDQDDTVLIPMSTAKKRVMGVDQANARAVTSIVVKVRHVADMRQTEEQIRELLRQRHRRQASQDDDFWISNLTEVVRALEIASSILTILLASIASVSLIVGGIGIMNIMLVSVTERTREIGLRMAVGARRRDILAQFLVEAMTLSLLGGLIGIGVGIAGAFAVAQLAQWDATLPLEAILLAFGFSGLVGIFFGFYPARKAARLSPIEALRYE